MFRSSNSFAHGFFRVCVVFFSFFLFLKERSGSCSLSSETGDLETQTFSWLDVLEIKEVTVLHNSCSEVVKNNPLLSRAKKESNLWPTMNT